MLITVFTTLLVITALVLILLIIALQQGPEGGAGAAFGGGNTTGFFGASGGVSFIVRATWITGALFFGLSMTLAWLKTHNNYKVGSELRTEIPGLFDPLAGTPASEAVPATPETNQPVNPETPLNP